MLPLVHSPQTRVEETELEGGGLAVGLAVLSLATGHGAHVRSKKKVYRERRLLFKMSTAVAGAAEGEASGAARLQLNPGTHTFPFTFRLPAALPGTCKFSDFFSSYNAEVGYRLEARVDAPGWLDATLKKPVTVLGNYAPGPSLIPNLKPFANSKSGSKSFLGSDGRFEATVTVPTGSILLGEMLKISVCVKNGTKVKLTKLRFKLKTHVGVTAIGHTDSDWGAPVLLGVVSNVVGAASARPLVVGARGSVDGAAQFRIPVNACTTHKSDRIVTAHSIEVEFVPEGWLHLSLRVSVPVFVLAAGGGLTPSAVGRVAAAPRGDCVVDAADAGAAAATAGDGGVASADDVCAALAEVGGWGGKKDPGTVDSTTPKGHTALHLACLRSQPELVRALIVAGCKPHVKTTAGFTALHSAAFGGDVATCVAVLEACDPGSTPQTALTAKGSTPAGLARKDILPDSPANPGLAELIEGWGRVARPTEPQDVESDDDADEADQGGAAGEDDASKMTQSGADASPAPSILQWMQDSESAVCTACQTPFSLFTRRHHCRGCGKLVCASCSPKWAPPGAASGVVPQRTCPSCVQAASA
jgi:hypothetical protein